MRSWQDPTWAGGCRWTEWRKGRRWEEGGAEAKEYGGRGSKRGEVGGKIDLEHEMLGKY